MTENEIISLAIEKTCEVFGRRLQPNQGNALHNTITAEIASRRQSLAQESQASFEPETDIEKDDERFDFEID